MSSGRPRDEAPPGFLTVREAAEMLHISRTAVRNRIERGTLPVNDVVLESGETRRYIPREAVEAILRAHSEPATREDTSEINLHGRELTQRVLTAMLEAQASLTEEIIKNREAIVSQEHAITDRLDKMGETMEEAVQIMRDATERERELQGRMIRLMDEEQERRDRHESRSLLRALFGIR